MAYDGVERKNFVSLGLSFGALIAFLTSLPELHLLRLDTPRGLSGNIRSVKSMRSPIQETSKNVSRVPITEQRTDLLQARRPSAILGHRPHALCDVPQL